jgi:hypothetical protein
MFSLSLFSRVPMVCVYFCRETVSCCTGPAAQEVMRLVLFFFQGGRPGAPRRATDAGTPHPDAGQDRQTQPDRRAETQGTQQTTDIEPEVLFRPSRIASIAVATNQGPHITPPPHQDLFFLPSKRSVATGTHQLVRCRVGGWLVSAFLSLRKPIFAHLLACPPLRPGIPPLGWSMRRSTSPSA